MRRSPRRPRDPKSKIPVYGIPVPEALHEAIETERGNLSKAESVLGCLAISMEHEADTADRPYYPDVAQLARELIRQSINRLDSLVLQRRLLKNRVEEVSALPQVGGYRGLAGARLALLEWMLRRDAFAQRPLRLDEDFRVDVAEAICLFDQCRSAAAEEPRHGGYGRTVSYSQHGDESPGPGERAIPNRRTPGVVPNPGVRGDEAGDFVQTRGCVGLRARMMAPAGPQEPRDHFRCRCLRSAPQISGPSAGARTQCGKNAARGNPIA